jgi:hypothetical protein
MEDTVARGIDKAYFDELKKVKKIEVRAIPLYKNLVPGIKINLPVLFNILVGPVNSSEKRKPLNICIVLDRSGSMGGKKLENCKNSICGIIKLMTVGDLFHLVIYDNEIEVFAENMNNDQALSQLDNIKKICSGNSTNISGGLEKGAELLNTYDEHLGDKIIFLFSDGQANSGITDLDEMRTKVKELSADGKIRISSYGIGTDFDEKMMRMISKKGNGEYYFIDSAESITSLVRKGLKYFANIVANNINLKVRGLGKNKLVELKNITSYEYLTKGVSIQELTQFDLHQILAIIEINDPMDDISEKLNVCKYSLNMCPIQKEYPTIISGTVDIAYSVTESNVEINQEVNVYMTILDCAKINMEIQNAIKLNDTCNAIKLKKTIIRMYKSVNEYDPYKIIDALLLREEKTLNDMENDEIISMFRKFNINKK